MKRLSLMALAVTVIMTACEKPVINETNATDGDGQPIENVGMDVKKFTFTLKGDFSTDWKPVTRGYLQADGKDLTDVWVLDYMDGQLIQQVHQSDNTAEDFGKPVLNLKYGSHHIYFIASRGQGADISTATHTINFTKALDTFYKDYEVNVISTSNGNRAVTLDRVVTKLRLTFTDAVNEKTSTVNITPGTWYHGWDYVSGTPANEKTNYTSSITIPTNELGKTGLQVNIYGFSTAEEWQTTVSVTSKHANGEIIGSTTLTNVPFKANRITEYAGPLFGSEGSMVLSLDTDWDDAYTGTW